MKLHFDVRFELKALHKLSGEWVSFVEEESRDYDENDDTFKKLVMEYEKETNKKRPDANNDTFDKEMLEYFVKSLSDSVRACKEELWNASEGAFQGRYKNATLSVGNNLINVFDFSAFRFGEIVTHIYKK